MNENIDGCSGNCHAADCHNCPSEPTNQANADQKPAEESNLNASVDRSEKMARAKGHEASISNMLRECELHGCTVPKTIQPSLAIRLQAATTHLIRAREELFNRTEEELQARDALKSEEAGLLLSGEINGKNEKERDAQLKARTAEQRKVLTDAEADVRAPKLWLEICQDKRTLLRDLLRCEELEQRQIEFDCTRDI